MNRLTRCCMLCLAGLFAMVAQLSAYSPYLEPTLECNLETQFWNARWISVPDTDPHAYGVYQFKKDVELAAVPTEYKVRVTGDNRYKLYVNGHLVSLGPARGDATHWNYETVDLAPFLNVGVNTIYALVFHEGQYKPEANVSVASGFLLQGLGAAFDLVTDKSWLCRQDMSYSPIKVRVPAYYVAGPGERVDMNVALGEWKQAVEGTRGMPQGHIGDFLSRDHALQPSILPQMELKLERIETCRKSNIKLPQGFPYTSAEVVIPANTEAEILLDRGKLTNAYLTMLFGGGKDSEISISYAEALYADVDNPRPKQKGNRNEIEGKKFVGRQDVIISNGNEQQKFETLAWRTYRYILLNVKTQDEPLSIHDLYGTFIGYPFKLNASFESSSDKSLGQIFDIGWYTARLCAIETYMDCPYYEQLQYLGDTRIQALISLYNSGDDRLVKNYLRQSDISRSPEGITMGRYPTSSPQYITPYSLSYIYALHDYMRYGRDYALVLDLIPGAEMIMHYYSHYQIEDGRIKNLPGWNFSDWVEHEAWDYGSPAYGADNCSILMDLQYLYALQLMSELEEFRGNTYLCAKYKDDAKKLAESITKAYWSEEKALFSDRIEKDIFSQHANSLAILCGLYGTSTPEAIAQKLLSDKSLAQCTVYYKFYLHEALIKAGLGDRYLEWLDIWRDNIAYGLTTWAETSNLNTSRSDCHAWGSSPNIEFLRTIAGIDSAAPGFKKVLIKPHLGALTELSATMPHPDGAISCNYKLKKSKLHVEIVIPEGVEAEFMWKGKSYLLKSGVNKFVAL